MQEGAGLPGGQLISESSEHKTQTVRHSRFTSIGVYAVFKGVGGGGLGVGEGTLLAHF